MNDKQFETVFKDTIRPLIREVSSSNKHQIYPIIYDGLLSLNLIKKKDNPVPDELEEEEGPGGFDHSRFSWNRQKNTDETNHH